VQSIRVTHAGDSAPDSRSAGHNDLSLEDFVMSGMDRDLYTALKGYGVVPPLPLLNAVFDRGQSGDAYTWEPFRISESDYARLAAALTENAHEGFVITDESLCNSPDFEHWFAALDAKIRANPAYKTLAWSVEHRLLGIPLGEGRWIARDSDLGGRKARNIDGALNPLGSFFRALEHCTPWCCRIEAYDFRSQNVLEQADELGRSDVIRRLEAAIIDLEELDPAIEVLESERLNSTLARRELEQLLDHFVTVLSRA